MFSYSSLLSSGGASPLSTRLSTPMSRDQDLSALPPVSLSLLLQPANPKRYLCSPGEVATTEDGKRGKLLLVWLKVLFWRLPGCSLPTFLSHRKSILSPCQVLRSAPSSSLASQGQLRPQDWSSALCPHPASLRESIKGGSLIQRAEHSEVKISYLN